MHDTAHVLVELFVLFAAAKLVGELFERLGQPEVVGEILAGVLVGPFALGWVKGGESLTAISELGVIILLFSVGLETQVSDLKRVGVAALKIGAWGVALPMSLGLGLMLVLGNTLPVALLVGTAMVATSVGVTARCLADLGALQTTAARLILAAAVIDDVLGMLILGSVSGMGKSGFSWMQLGFVALVAVGFVLFIAVIGTALLRKHGPLMDRPRIKESPFVLSLILCLGLSALSNSIGLAAIIGAFLAGMVVAETREQYNIEHQIRPVAGFLVPFFFAATGMQVDIRALGSVAMLGLCAALILIAILSKLVACGLAAKREGKQVAWLVGVGMIPRGEVGIIVASIGLRNGTIDKALYGVVVVMCIATTVIVPPVLKHMLRTGPPLEGMIPNPLEVEEAS